MAERLLRPRLEKFYRCLDLYRQCPGTLVWALFLAFVYQILRVVMVWIGAYALRMDVGIADLVAFVPIVIFIGLLPVSFNGLGVREVAYVYFFKQLGVVEEQAFALSLLLALMNYLGALPGVLVSYSGFRRTPPSSSN